MKTDHKTPLLPNGEEESKRSKWLNVLIRCLPVIFLGTTLLFLVLLFADQLPEEVDEWAVGTTEEAIGGVSPRGWSSDAGPTCCLCGNAKTETATYYDNCEMWDFPDDCKNNGCVFNPVTKRCQQDLVMVESADASCSRCVRQGRRDFGFVKRMAKLEVDATAEAAKPASERCTVNGRKFTGNAPCKAACTEVLVNRMETAHVAPACTPATTDAKGFTHAYVTWNVDKSLMEPQHWDSIMTNLVRDGNSCKPQIVAYSFQEVSKFNLAANWRVLDKTMKVWGYRSLVASHQRCGPLCTGGKKIYNTHTCMAVYVLEKSFMNAKVTMDTSYSGFMVTTKPMLWPLPRWHNVEQCKGFVLGKLDLGEPGYDQMHFATTHFPSQNSDKRYKERIKLLKLLEAMSVAGAKAFVWGDFNMWTEAAKTPKYQKQGTEKGIPKYTKGGDELTVILGETPSTIAGKTKPWYPTEVLAGKHPATLYDPKKVLWKKKKDNNGKGKYSVQEVLDMTEWKTPDLGANFKPSYRYEADDPEVWYLLDNTNFPYNKGPCWTDRLLYTKNAETDNLVKTKKVGQVMDLTRIHEKKKFSVPASDHSPVYYIFTAEKASTSG